MTRIALVRTTGDKVDVYDDCSMLGLLNIATYAKEQGGYSDMHLLNGPAKESLEKLAKLKPDIVGLTSMAYTQKHADELALGVKERLDVPVLLGGVHVSTLPGQMKACFDAGVIGEGEATMLEVIKNYEKSGKVFDSGIAGLACKRGGKLVLNRERPLIEPLDKIPIPDRSLLGEEYYKPMLHWTGKKYVTSSVMTSRGCVYRCRFCSSAAFWKRIRFHSTAHVVDELEGLHKKYGVESVFLWDDFFTANVPRLEEIGKLMRERDLAGRLKLQVQSRVDVPEKAYALMKEMGVFTVNFGLESGSNKTLGYLKKDTTTVEQNKRAIEAAMSHGLVPTGSLIFASPNETLEDMRESIDFVKWMAGKGMKFVGFYAATPYPMTDLWEVAVQKGKVQDGMDFSLLEQADLQSPMLLEDSVDRKEYAKLVEELMQLKVKYFDANKGKWVHEHMQNKMKKALSNPRLLLRLIRYNPGLLVRIATSREKKSS
jgi:anaerobic magnesium-protoporphyrin IX monomethyl ester cyclase